MIINKLNNEAVSKNSKNPKSLSKKHFFHKQEKPGDRRVFHLQQELNTESDRNTGIINNPTESYL